MGKVNIHLKWSYTGMISLIGVISILLLGLTLYSYGFEMEHENTDQKLLFCFSTLLLATTGGFGVWKRKKWALVMFSAGGTLIGLFLLVTSCFNLIAQSQMENTVRNHYLNLLPLSNASERELHDLSYRQKELQCCGVESYTDWGKSLPSTCLCDQKSTNPCFDLAASQDENWFVGNLRYPPVMTYSKPCLPLIIAFYTQMDKIGLGILLGFFILWFVSVALGITILCRMNEKQETPKVVFGPENYSCLTEAPDSNLDTWLIFSAKKILRMLDKIENIMQ